MLLKKEIYKPLRGLFTACLYIAFFTVQLFFNFDLQASQAHDLQGNLFQNVVAQNTSHQFFKQKVSVTGKTNVRLNKRFEPESIADCEVPSITISFVRNAPLSLAYYYNDAILSAVTLSISLRGPPVLA